MGLRAREDYAPDRHRHLGAAIGHSSEVHIAMVEHTKRVQKNKQAPAAKAMPAPDLPAHPAEKADAHFPIVGIGASAGGLEALESFMQNVPVDCGMAFVVIQLSLI